MTTPIRKLPISTTGRYILYALVDKYGSQSNITAIVDELADVCGISRDTFMRASKELDKEGYLKVTKGIGRKSNDYKLNV